MDGISGIRDYGSVSSLYETGSRQPAAAEISEEHSQVQTDGMQNDKAEFTDESEELIAANITKGAGTDKAQQEKDAIIKEYKRWYDETKSKSKDKLVCDATQKDILKDMKKHFGSLDSQENWNIGPVYARKQEGGSYGHYGVGIFDKEGKLDTILDPVPPRASGFWVQDAPRTFSPSEWSDKWSSPIYGEKNVLPDNENPRQTNNRYINEPENDVKIFR